MAEDLGERTEQPTSRRMRDARSRGQVARSTNLAAAVEMGGAAILLATMGASLLFGLAALVRDALGEGVVPALFAPALIGPTIRHIAGRAALLVAPFMGIAFVIAIAAHAAQVGWLLTSEPLRPKLSRLNPLSGMHKLVGRRNLIKSGVDSLKLCVLLGLLAWFIGSSADRIAGLASLGALPGFLMMSKLVRDLCVWLIVLALIIGIIDYAYQRWQHLQDLRMTRQEVRDERRSMEGDAEVKGRRLRMARQLILQRIRGAVPTADVIVTNPTHFAVALRYDAGSMDAPRVVAKGADYLAFRIREIAAAHDVPIIEKPVLARALYHGVEVGGAVPPKFYQAVAEILAHVYRLKQKAA